MRSDTLSPRSEATLWDCAAAGCEVLDGLSVARVVVPVAYDTDTGCNEWHAASSGMCTCDKTICCWSPGRRQSEHGAWHWSRDI